MVAPGTPASPGPAWAWGANNYGQLGNGTTLNSSLPVQVSPPSGNVTAIASGGNHVLALTSTGQVLGWGNNFNGQLGNWTTTNSSTPVTVSLPPGTTVTAIAGGSQHSLAVTSAGKVLAWGSNFNGQLGDGTRNSSSTPVAVNLPAYVTVTAIAAGGDFNAGHSLALTSSGAVWAWGDNRYGQLGDGTTVSMSSTPVAVIQAVPFTAIAAGRSHSLAVTSPGQVLAWGDNSYGQLGNSTTFNSNTPIVVSLPLGTTATAVAGGVVHSMTLTSTGQVLAWGYNTYGQLGNGTTTNSAPVAVSLPAGTTVTAIASGSSHSLALTSTGKELAWGNNATGQLGNGTTTNSSTPVLVNAPPVTLAIAAGEGHSMAVQLPAVAVLPAMTNGAYGGYVTAATIKNAGSVPALVRIAYFNQTGAAVGSGDVISSLPVNASWTVRQDNGNSFPSSGGDAAQAGSAVVYSSQPIASFVNEFPPGNVGDATSYSGVQVPGGVGTTLYAPTIVNNAYGGYTTGIGLLNQGGSPTDVTITYRDGSGIVVKTQTVTALAAHAYRALYSGDTTLALPGGFAGTATITSTGGQLLGAIVNETGPGGQFSSYDAVPAGSSLLSAPVALNNAYGGYYTGMGIQNTAPTAATVSITYYDAAGTPTAKVFTIPAFGSLGVYQGSATDGPPVGAYTAEIQSARPLAAIVNEVAPPGVGSARQSTSYNTFNAGMATLHLPLVENAGSDPWNTGQGIMNTGSASTTVTVSYYDAITGATVGTPQMLVLAPRAYWGLYQPTGGLPIGSRATAVVTTSTGGQVAVVCNESSPTTFMSYNGQ
jgi:alpha-tubulin suppressor-like RCC1 family protein